jgi:endoplasmic reticulum-Golgi intermediate compartment protein 2
VFFKFDIEPITLTIAEEWGGWLALLVRLVNVVSGVMVAGGWAWTLYDWGLEVWGRRGRGKNAGLGVLGRSEKVMFD